MLTGGTLGDLFGRKRVMLAGVAVFCAGSLIAALADGNGVLIGARVMMGIGAAASEPGTLSMIRHVYPDPRRRARALGVWTAVSGTALALGPIIGGVLVAASSWRAVFWFNVGFGVLAFAAAAAVLPESADPEGRRLDIPGLTAGGAAVTAATFAVIEGESAGYGRWWVGLLFAVAAAAAVSFIYVERRSPDPVLKLEFFRQPTFTAAIEAVTHGAVPSSASSVHNPAAVGHEALVAKVIQAAEDAFGRGLHISLLLAGAMLFSAAVLSLLAAHRPPLSASAAAPSRA